MSYSIEYKNSCYVQDKEYWQNYKKYTDILKFIEGVLGDILLYDTGSLMGHEWDSSAYLDIPVALSGLEQLKSYLENYPSSLDI